MTRFFPLLALSLLQGACAGAGANVRVSLDQAQYPVSMSSWVPGPDGIPLGPDDLKEVDQVNLRGTGRALVWGFLPLGDVNLSEELNQAVADAHGEAVTNLTLTIRSSLWNIPWPLIWCPFHPGAVNVELHGDIVRRGVSRSKKAPARSSPPFPKR